MNIAIMHYDLPRTNWHANILQNITYRNLKDFNINYKIIFYGEEFPDSNIDLIDFSEWCNPWHQKIANTYSIPLVCSTEESSVESLKKYLRSNNINIEFMLSRISHFIARSSLTKDVLLQFGIEEKKISILSYGTDLELFKPINKEPEEPAFLYIGSINRQKGVQHLIDAYLRIMDKTDWKLKMCIGEFNNDLDLLKYVLDLTKIYDKIQILHFPSILKLPDIYNESTCFCLIQDFNSPTQFSNPCVWACSCGLPIISLNIGALRDYIEDNKSGFLCKDTNEVSEKMLEITTRDWKDMGKISRIIAERKHDPKKIAARYKEIYGLTINNSHTKTDDQ